jgi:hypothetical protein
MSLKIFKKFSLSLLTVVFLFGHAGLSQASQVASLEVPALMTLSEHLSLLAENLLPGSSAKIALGLMAISMNPKLMDLDMTKPLKLYFYPAQGAGKSGTTWIIVVDKKGKKTPGMIEVGSYSLFCREIDKKLVLCQNKQFLNNLKTIPDYVDSESDLNISVYPADYLKNCKKQYLEIRNKFIRNLLVKLDGTDTSNLTAMKILSLKLDYFEKVLKQIEKIDCRFVISAKGIKLDGTIKPLKNSSLETFILQQKNVPALPGIYKDHAFVMSSSFNITPEFRQAVIGMNKELAIECAENDQDLKYLKFMDLILKSWTGQMSYFMDAPESGAFSFMKLFTGSNTSPSADGYFPSHPEMKTDIPGMYRLTKYKLQGKSLYQLFCKPENSDILFLNGKIDSSKAGEIFKAIPQQKLETLKRKGVIAALIFQPTKGKESETPPEATYLYFLPENGLLKMEIEFCLGTIKASVPDELRPKKENKRQRIKLKFPKK